MGLEEFDYNMAPLVGRLGIKGWLPPGGSGFCWQESPTRLD